MYILLILSLSLSEAWLSLLAASQYESCINTGVDLNCTDKMIVTLSLENSQMNGTESFETVFNSVTAPNSSKTFIIQKPLKVFVQKSQVIARYTIIYKQDFNYRPVETIITTDIFSCSDGAYDNNPNCGWQTDANGNRILNSQGFCCNCQFFEILGLESSQMNRAKDCGNLNIGEGSATASCLRFDELYYGAYQIISQDLYYTINIWIYEDGNDTALASFVLDPSSTVKTDPGLGCTAEIIGDFYPSQPPPPISSYYLLMPSRPTSNLIVQQGSMAWMLIDPSLITFDGSECNKIGVSYDAFETQSSKCTQVVGSCLNNQLYDYYNSDLTYIQEGKTPQYLLQAWV